MTLFLLSLAVISLAVFAMGVGLIFNRPCLKGSCGSSDEIGRKRGLISCFACPNRKSD